MPTPAPRDECFLAGTQIDMWDGTEKPIEEVKPGDTIVSYDRDGKLVPGKVSRTFENRVRHILDVHGLMVTPGHVTFCARVQGEDHPFAGRHVPVIDILRCDGALMKKDGSLVRASTGAPVGSLGDRLVWAVVGEPGPDGRIVRREERQIRLGTRFITPDGEDHALLDLVHAASLIITEEGRFCTKPGGPAGAFHWKFSRNLPKPEDYVLQRSALTLEDIYTVDEWEGVRPHMPAPVNTGQMGGEAGPSFGNTKSVWRASAMRSEMRDAIPPNIPLSMRGHPNQPTMSRKQRRAHEARMRKAGVKATATMH